MCKSSLGKEEKHKHSRGEIGKCSGWGMWQVRRTENKGQDDKCAWKDGQAPDWAGTFGRVKEFVLIYNSSC